MAQYKKILVSLPMETIEGIDELSAQEGISKSEFIRQGLKDFVLRKKRKQLREALRDGYVQMGDINLSLAEMYFEADNDAQLCYEEKLSECEV